MFLKIVGSVLAAAAAVALAPSARRLPLDRPKVHRKLKFVQFPSCRVFTIV